MADHVGRATADIALVASDVFNTSIEVVQLSDELLTQRLIAAGIPAEAAALWVAFEANTRAGNADVFSNAVEVLTGIPAQPLRDFLHHHKTALTAAV